MEHLFIINPTAGKTDRSRELKEKIESIGIGEKVTIKITSKAGEATDIVKDYLENARDRTRVYACGGDGTANEVLRGLVRHENASMGVIPIGSGNDLVRSFKGFKSEDFLNIAAMMQGEEQQVDIMECQGRYSMNVLSVGFDCAVAKNVDKFKKLPLISSGLAYKLSIIFCLFTKRSHRLKISVDGKPFCDLDKSTLLAAAGNGCYYGGGIKATPKAELDDGKIEFMHIPTISAVKFISLLSTYIKGEHVDNPKLSFVTSIKCDSLTFEAEKEIDVNFEGEIVLMKNPTIRICPKAVKVIVPRVKEAAQAQASKLNA